MLILTPTNSAVNVFDDKVLDRSPVSTNNKQPFTHISTYYKSVGVDNAREMDITLLEISRGHLKDHFTPALIQRIPFCVTLSTMGSC